ncbi:hypothetical protein ASPVEDRAFT_68476 [Aspergillus versicolor CBS 583.65]|uniref:Inner membrane assembly complex subunit 17 n=1 Tax=Aspergillus versicolor CBS 583.65 TaxID=1036611 RepID=A0A1L9P8A6_ASPVE|nr:uncharacterized protein ASPVEDRAFT_68476 [Aspergillus versicolor CBS 583.65]OJI97759.1 hypothetical protein ASPVEDRAFT_68476 [Aspergillus versicolor CBS 583.65]
MPLRINPSFSQALFRRNITTTDARLNTGMPPHPPPQQPPSAYKEGMSRYKHFFSPFAKVFLGAVFTYQVLYWTWVKLEMEEVKADKNKQLAALEKEARELTGVKK